MEITENPIYIIKGTEDEQSYVDRFIDMSKSKFSKDAIVGLILILLLIFSSAFCFFYLAFTLSWWWGYGLVLDITFLWVVLKDLFSDSKKQNARKAYQISKYMHNMEFEFKFFEDRFLYKDSVSTWDVPYSDLYNIFEYKNGYFFSLGNIGFYIEKNLCEDSFDEFITSIKSTNSMEEIK